MKIRIFKALEWPSSVNDWKVITKRWILFNPLA